MKRWLSVAVLVVGTVLWSVQPAYANLWDWLQELSGPGPFHARKPNVMVDLCQENHVGSGKLTQDFDSTKPPVTCIFADLRLFANEDDDNFSKNNKIGFVHVTLFETGVTANLHRAFSVGFGGGLMKIGTPDHSEYKGVLTAPRVVIRPAVLFGTEQFWKDNKLLYAVLGSVKYYVRANIVLRDLRGDTFGLKQGDPDFDFHTHFERLASAGFIIDATPILAYLNNR
jgi:hypothetical protein